MAGVVFGYEWAFESSETVDRCSEFVHQNLPIHTHTYIPPTSQERVFPLFLVADSKEDQYSEVDDVAVVAH